MKNPYILTFVILTLAVSYVPLGTVWSQDNSEAPSNTPKATETTTDKEVAAQNEDALNVVREARARLFRHQTVRADIVQRVSLGDFRFEASGKYLAGEGFRSRIEYRVTLGELEGEFLEVCDGQILHTRRQIVRQIATSPTTETPQIELTRRDIQKILRETQLYLDQPEAVRAAEIGIGGLPAILASLERTMVFEAIREVEEGGRQLIVVQGRWDLAQQERLIAGLGGLAAQVQNFFPDRVQITFAKDTLFPTSFQYLKKLPNNESSYRPMLTVAFQNAVINEPIPLQNFNYISPPGLEERDETAQFIEAIQQAAAPPVQQTAPDAAGQSTN